MKSECPFIVLTRYVPTRWRAWFIGRELTAITKKMGLIPHDDPVHGPITTSSWCSVPLHAEVRRFTSDKYAAEGWHQDGDLQPGSKMDHAIVVWSNRTPTEFLYKDKVWQPEPFELVIARNMSCSHRRAKDCPPKRWLFRQRVEVPKHLPLP